MSLAINKRSVMTLFSGKSDIYSHQIRLVLTEKEIAAEIEFVNINALPQDLIDLNPYATLPTLVDRELTLYEPHIILEYLDERYPHPPLFPVYPIARANARLIMHRIRTEWYAALETVLTQPGTALAEQKADELRNDLTAISPVFKEYDYFMSNEFNLIDCYMAPLLWRLPKTITLPKSAEKHIKLYQDRLFDRETFKVSLTPAEREMRR